MTTPHDEFASTHPWTVAGFDVDTFDDPKDQPRFVALMLTCVNRYDPRRTIVHTYRLDPHDALDLASTLTFQPQSPR